MRAFLKDFIVTVVRGSLYGIAAGVLGLMSPLCAALFLSFVALPASFL